MLRLILENNIFLFNNELYSQEEGTSMGPRHAPHFADIFMARKIDPKIKAIFRKYVQGQDDFLKRFLDDLFKLFIGTTQDLHKIFEEMNKIHPSIKFTMSHTTNRDEDISTRCTCPNKDSVQYLDTSCQIIEGKIIFDLFKKPTDRNMYLLPSSCHPPHQHQNIPFSLAMRINRVCSAPELREMRFKELKEMLTNRSYKLGMIEGAIKKARDIPRDIALQKVVKTQKNKETSCSGLLGPKTPTNGHNYADPLACNVQA